MPAKGEERQAQQREATPVQSDHLVRMIRARIASTPDSPAMRYRAGSEWRRITFREMGAHIDVTASWLIEQAGVAAGDRVVIFSPNTPWWSIADLAIMSAGAIPVPIYATNTAAQAEHIVRDAGAKVAFAGGAEHCAKLASVGGGVGLSHLVVFDEATPFDAGNSWRMSQVVGHPLSPHLAGRVAAGTRDDVATIIYTSGTTGDPKGAVLTFDNLLTQFEAVDAFFRVTGDDRSLCFLPLSHAYERTWTFYVLLKGAENVYLDDPKRVIDTMQEVRPTCMVSVPRLYEKIYATARHRVSEASGLRRRLFDWALGVGSQVGYARKRGEKVGVLRAAQHAMADRLVLHKIRDIVGGPKNFFSAGGAALSPQIEEFFFAAGLLICQGYGLTETSPMVTCNRPDDFRFGTVGKVIPGCEIRIASDGEILVRGRNVMRGYYGRPRETMETFEDGWLKTGDIGDFDADGFLRITDRKKDIIITSGGKNIAPSRIESVIGQDYYIEQVAAVGDGRHYLSALIVPHFEALEQWARERGITYDSLCAMVKDARIVAFIAERVEQQQAVLARHEQVKKFTLLADRFSQMGGEITPTLKNVRSAIAAKHAQVINAMYAGESLDGRRET